MLDGLLNNLLKNDIETHENIRKLAPGPGNDCMNDFLLNHLYFKTKNCKLIAIDLAIKQFEITANLDPVGDAYRKIIKFFSLI